MVDCIVTPCGGAKVSLQMWARKDAVALRERSEGHVWQCAEPDANFARLIRPVLGLDIDPVDVLLEDQMRAMALWGA
jgi:hypothetical protein